MRGCFITIEGPDGAGKTSIIEEIVPKLRDVAQCDIVATREPGGNPISEKIRHIILDNENMMMDDRTEALLYTAARRQHIVETIAPALEAGKMVICDRFVDSSLAYQGKGRNIGMDEVTMINRFATEGLEPDLTIYLDIDAEAGIRRLSGKADRLESEGIAFHQRVRHGYLELLQQNPERMVRIDARHPFEQVVEEVLAVIECRYPRLFR